MPFARHRSGPGAGQVDLHRSAGALADRAGPKGLAVLAVDPSSSVTGGSILGDKTRMEPLSSAKKGFIRPSPSAGGSWAALPKDPRGHAGLRGGRFDVIIIETVGVGQSETAVAGMVDMFCLLQLPNAGDDLQAIKKASSRSPTWSSSTRPTSTPGSHGAAASPDGKQCAGHAAPGLARTGRRRSRCCRRQMQGSPNSGRPFENYRRPRRPEQVRPAASHQAQAWMWH